MHLNSIEQSEYLNQELEIEARINALGEPMQIPTTVTARCSGFQLSNGEVRETSSECQGCPYHGDGNDFNLSESEQRIINLIRQSDAQIIGHFKRIISEETPISNSRCIENLRIVPSGDRVKVTPVNLVPVVRRVRSENGSLVDESGNTYQEKLIYVLGEHNLETREYTFSCKPTTNPHNQEITAVAYSLSPIDDFLSSFEINDEVVQRLSYFQPQSESVEDINTKFQTIIDDSTEHVTRVYGDSHSRFVLGSVLLTYFSTTELYFNSEFLRRAPINILIVGDTSTGKTRLAENFIDGTIVGKMVNGAAAGRTGLLYHLDDRNGRNRLLKWGLLPQENKRLVMIDECQNFNDAMWGEFTRPRSEGIIEVNRVRRGEHEMKTRLVFIANSKDRRTDRYKRVDDFIYGIEACQIMNMQDIRRFDAVIVIAQGDAPEDAVTRRVRINETRRSEIVQALQKNIAHCWKKNYLQRDTFVYHDFADELILQRSRELSRDFRNDAIPLFEDDTKEKVARMSAAAANLLPVQIDQRVHIFRGHVDFVVDWLRENYSHPSNRLNDFAAAHSSSLCDEDYRSICNLYVDDSQLVKRQLIDLYRTQDYYTNSNLENEIGNTISTLRNNHIRALRNLDLIIAATGGYRRRPKLARFFQRFDNEQ
jgi:hypothetical protein